MLCTIYTIQNTGHRMKQLTKKIFATISLISLTQIGLADDSSTGFSNINEPPAVSSNKSSEKGKTKSKLNSKSTGEEKILYELGNDPEVNVEKKVNSKVDLKDLPKEMQDYMAQKDDGSLYRKDATGKSDKDPKKAQDTLRENTIESTAVGFAAQAGLKWRYENINKIIKSKYEGRLDEVNFRPFVTDKNILTPSILITKDEENFESPQKLIKSNINFVVADEARIVSVPPTYRDYLIRNFTEPKKIHPALKPRDEMEMEAWKKGILKGWMIGVKQANDIFADGLLRLERDIQGRVNYRKMVSLKMISPAALKVTKRGVTFNDRTMNVGETVYEITNVANFTNLEDWRSAWLKAEEFGAK